MLCLKPNILTAPENPHSSKMWASGGPATKPTPPARHNQLCRHEFTDREFAPTTSIFARDLGWKRRQGHGQNQYSTQYGRLARSSIVSGTFCAVGGLAQEKVLPLGRTPARILLREFLDLQGDKAQSAQDALVERKEAVEVAGAVIAKRFELVCCRNVILCKLFEREILAGVVERISRFFNRRPDRFNGLFDLRREFINAPLRGFEAIAAPGFLGAGVNGRCESAEFAA
jgi:hypothetical protein